MAEQLKASGRTATTWSLVLDDLRVSIRRPQVAVVPGLLVALPPLSGIAVLPGYALDHWMSYFTLMFDWVALAYPLLIALLTQPRLLDEWSNTYAWMTRTRVRPSRYFSAKIAASAVLAAAVFLTMTLVCFLVARLTYTDHGYDIPLAAPIETRFAFSQLWAVSPALYIAVYSFWVALVSATVAAWCTTLTALIGNKFLALAAPFVLAFIVDFVLAVAGLEAYSLPPFRFNIKQQPIWTELVGWVAFLAATAVLYAIVRRRDYQSDGIVRS